MTTIDDIIKECEQRKVIQRRKYSHLAAYIATTLPSLKELSNREKRTVIRNHVGKHADQLEGIDHYRLYAAVCSVMERDYGLNDEDETGMLQ